ncbi:hypothetical protein RINTHM_8770 [Richelia intracellularis HM01]|nr:hypothetical protein RINTHM_8770 [Richelia intracellularis HM01]
MTINTLLPATLLGLYSPNKVAGSNKQENILVDNYYIKK